LNPVPIDVKVVWHNRPFEAIIQEVISEKHDLLLKDGPANTTSWKR
jgi:hypothetical protein